jgi:AAA family ATP:ADP antiporter
MASPARAVRVLWRSVFDIRPGEGGRVLFMSLYLFFVLSAYYIIKTASRSLFLNKFDIEKFPVLLMLIAAAGGVFAYLYTKVAVQASLRRAVTWTMSIAFTALVLFWWLIRFDPHWLLYAFNVFVSMFSIITVSQGYLVASNVFNPREAKRLYVVLGLGAVAGAASGGLFTSYVVHSIGTRNLLLASAALVLVAYGCFHGVLAQKGVSLAGVRATGKDAEQFSFQEIPSAIRRHRHLQVIIGIMLLMFMVDSMLEYQFSAMAKQAYKGDHLTAFFGNFYGLYLNLLNFGLQLFFTAPVVRWIGVGGALSVMPAAMAGVSLVTMASPRLFTTALARLSEAASRNTLNKTGMELLYLPLPLELRNRTKAFLDICIDRFGRGIGGALLLALIALDYDSPRQIAFATFCASAAWALLSALAGKEYIRTVRRRLEVRRLDLEGARVNVQDPVTLRLLEQALASSNPRQVCYALSTLAEAPQYKLTSQLTRLAAHESVEVRTKVYELARAAKFDGVLDCALKEVWTSSPGQDGSIRPAVAYILSCSAETTEMTKLFLDYPNWVVGEAALEALQRESAEDFLTNEWLSAAAESPDPHRRSLAALAVGVRGDQGTEALFRLLQDPDRGVVAAALRSAGSIQNRAYVPRLVSRLADPRLRGAAIESLAAYGTKICGALGDMLDDDHLPAAVRRQIPRVLRLIPDQRSAGVLLASINHPDLGIRYAVLKALNRLRQTAPGLNFGAPAVNDQVYQEARYYFALKAALAPFQNKRCPGTAACLLARTIDERLRQTLERLFRLLGLRYPPKQIYAAYLAVNQRGAEEFAAAIEFLDNVMDRELKRVVLPLLDAEPHQAGRELFGLETLDAEAAVRELIRSGDPWLKACAIATAAEQGMRGLRDDISGATSGAGADVIEVARAAVASLSPQSPVPGASL